MSGKGLNDLGLKNEAMPQGTLDDLPEFGGFTPPPQPGPYRFQLPVNLSKAWDVLDIAEKGQRVKLVLDKDAPLLIVQSPSGKVNGDTFQTQLTNVERKRGKDAGEHSDMDYLLKAFGEKAKPKTNQEYCQKVMANAGKEFGSDIRWTWFCNDKKNIWTLGEDGKLTEVEGTKGCGRRYYQEGQTSKDDQKIAKQEDGNFPLQVTCVCGGVVRGFASLDNIRA